MLFNDSIYYNKQSSVSLPFRTFAYIQELDKTISLLNQMCHRASEWRAKAKGQFELIFYLLCNRTIKFFSQSISSSISENFVPVSYLEKISEKIILSNKSKDNDDNS